MPWRNGRGGGITRSLSNPFNLSALFTAESGVTIGSSDECSVDGDERVFVTSDFTLSPARSLSANEKIVLCKATDAGLVEPTSSGDFACEVIDPLGSNPNGGITFTAPSAGTYSSVRVEDLEVTDE